MNYFKLSVFILTLGIGSCNTNDTPTPSTDIETEFIEWKANGIQFSSPSSLAIRKDISSENGNFGCSFSEVSHYLYCDNSIAGTYTLNQLYNSNEIDLSLQLGHEGNSVDTLFDFVTLKITRNDNEWIEGEFTANDCKVRQADNTVNPISLVITEGKFKLKK